MVGQDAAGSRARAPRSASTPAPPSSLVITVATRRGGDPAVDVARTRITPAWVVRKDHPQQIRLPGSSSDADPRN